MFFIGVIPLALLVLFHVKNASFHVKIEPTIRGGVLSTLSRSTPVKINPSPLLAQRWRKKFSPELRIQRSLRDVIPLSTSGQVFPANRGGISVAKDRHFTPVFPLMDFFLSVKMQYSGLR